MFVGHGSSSPNMASTNMPGSTCAEIVVVMRHAQGVPADVAAHLERSRTISPSPSERRLAELSFAADGLAARRRAR